MPIPPLITVANPAIIKGIIVSTAPVIISDIPTAIMAVEHIHKNRWRRNISNNT